MKLINLPVKGKEKIEIKEENARINLEILESCSTLEEAETLLNTIRAIKKTLHLLIFLAIQYKYGFSEFIDSRTTKSKYVRKIIKNFLFDVKMAKIKNNVDVISFLQGEIYDEKTSL